MSAPIPDPERQHAESVRAQVPVPEPKCDHICLKDDGHVERGEPHFYGYEHPSPRRQHAEYERGYLAGLEEAARLVMSAPLLAHGQRRADVPGGVPRVLDHAVDEDGDPNFVYCNYALRDAILHWLVKRGALIDGPAAISGEERADG